MSDGAKAWGTNSGHGHVWSRPDGIRARCGGPGLCAECKADAEQFKHPHVAALEELAKLDQRMWVTEAEKGVVRIVKDIAQKALAAGVVK